MKLKVIYVINIVAWQASCALHRHKADGTSSRIVRPAVALDGRVIAHKGMSGYLSLASREG